MSKRGKIREKSHRLPRAHYQGLITVAFTLCIKGRVHCFINDAVVSHAISLLADVLKQQKARAVVYCFMPDHVHLIIEGREAVSDLWQAVVDFKQLMGFWFSKNLPNVKWQKDFYDHIFMRDEDLGTRIRYILDNPVRWGMVKDWRQYPYKGAIGYNLNKTLIQVK